jgi:hypothetical protein
MSMRKLTPKLYNKENGQALVETALTLPIFILILCGILDFGWLFTNQLMLNNSSREAARTGVVNYVEFDTTYEELVKTKVKDMIFFGKKEEPDLMIYVSVDPTETDVTVKVDSIVPCLTPIVGAFYPGNKATLTSTTTMRIG